MSFDLEGYVPVAERLELFRKEHPDWSLISTVVVDDGTRVLIRAEVQNDGGYTIAVGHAEEIRGAGHINKTSALENCETSAWGRALANLGYEVKRGIASREEMSKPVGVAATGVAAPAKRGKGSQGSVPPPLVEPSPATPAPVEASTPQPRRGQNTWEAAAFLAGVTPANLLITARRLATELGIEPLPTSLESITDEKLAMHLRTWLQEKALAPRVLGDDEPF